MFGIILAFSWTYVQAQCTTPGFYDSSGGCAACYNGCICPGDGFMYTCAGGYYNLGAVSTSGSGCTPCSANYPSGYYAANCGTACYQCDSTHYISFLQTSCTATCQAGSYVSSNHERCVQCAAGTYSAASATSCTTCPAGHYSGSGASSCSICSLGTYSGAGASACINCPTGYISTVSGATSISDCTACAVGTTNDSLHQNCISCVAGTYWSAYTCIDCTAGNYQPNQGQTSCIPCTAGTYATTSAAISCTQCAANTFTSTTGSTSCTNCDFAMFSNSGAATCYAVCGDGMKASVEGCDDNNLTDGDGCSSNCVVEQGYICKESPSTSPSICNTICGDGKRAGTEICDDGNLNNGDGCSSTCLIESGFECIGGTPTTPDTCHDICGDGVVVYKTSTNCDDGNTISGDGCSSTCAVENGWDCTGGSLSSTDHCSIVCGNGILTSQYEECDDGNRISGDGCNIFCKIESGCTCTTNFSAPINSICSEVCGDGKNIGMKPCDDGNTQNGDGCSSSCTIESGFTCSGGTISKKDTCLEICGDARNCGANECDDGNLNNGDGCSSSCQFETCYECIGGSSTSKDTCSLLYITPNITSISSDNTILIGFSHSMNQASITINDLQVTISSSYTIDFSWSATYIDTKALKLSINTRTVLEGGEKIIIKFTNYKIFRAPRGGCLTAQELSTTLYGSLISSSNLASSLSFFAQYTAYLGIIVTVILIIVGGGSLEMVWALLNTMQIISYLPLMTDYFPQHVRIMYLILKFSNLNFDFLSEIFKKMISYSSYPSASYSDLFSKNGFDSSLILDNCASILFTIILYTVFFLMAFILLRLHCFKTVTKICNYIISLFLFNYILRFMTEGYLEICFGSILNLFAFERSTIPEIFSLVISFAFAVVFVVFPFMCFALIYDKRKELTDENETYIRRFGTMYENLKNDKGWEYLQFYPLFLLRRLIFVCILILLEGYSEIQCNIFVASSSIMLAYVLFLKPFKDEISNILIIINEAMLFLISNLQIIFTTRSKDINTINYTGWVMISIVCINVLSNFIICILYNIKTKIKKIREKRLKK